MALTSSRLAVPARVLLVVLFLAPFVPLLLWAVADRWSYPAVVPQDFGLSGWNDAVDAGGASAMRRSLVLAAAVSAIATPLGALAARGLVLHDVPWRGALTTLLIAPVILPGFAVALGLDVLLIRADLAPTTGVVLVLSVAAIPYTTFLMRAAYGAYDTGYEDEARTLGASPRQVLLRVQLPMLAPALAGAALLAFLVGWADYTVTLLIGGGRLVTLPLLTASSSSAIGNEAVVAVLSLCALAPPLLLFGMVRRLGRRGVLA